MSEPTRTRIQFDASSRCVEQIDQIVTMTDTPTRADAIRGAIKWYLLLLRRAEEDGYVTFVRKDGTPERWIL